MEFSPTDILNHLQLPEDHSAIFKNFFWDSVVLINCTRVNGNRYMHFLTFSYSAQLKQLPCSKVKWPNSGHSLALPRSPGSNINTKQRQSTSATVSNTTRYALSAVVTLCRSVAE